MHPKLRANMVETLIEISLNAGAEIMRIYKGDIDVRTKDDASPVTDADEAAEEIIIAGLRAASPDIPIVAEESVNAGEIPDISGGRFWLVDPLDGTKEFINRNGEFTVNIALIDQAIPVMGVVYAPALGKLYAGGPEGAYLRQDEGNGKWSVDRAITVRAPPEKGLTVVASRSHRNDETDAFIDRNNVAEIRTAGSSIKLCLIAEGQADLYPRLGRTMEWDIAAGHAVLKAAGGSVETIDGKPFTYGKPAFENPHFIARGKLP